MPTRRADLPTDVEPEQIWKEPGGQHYRVASLTNGVATLHRCTPAGRVLNQRYKETVSVERMQADYKPRPSQGQRPGLYDTARLRRLPANTNPHR